MNLSAASFTTEATPEGTAIRFGLGNIRNVGEGFAAALIEARREHGRFGSIEEFCKHCGGLNKRILESLAKAGALDSLGERGTLVANVDRIAALAQREEKLRDSGQATMFDLFGATVDAPIASLQLDRVEVARSEQLAWERELLGVYVSEHPFRTASRSLGSRISTILAEINAELNGREVTIAGMVSFTRSLLTKDGRAFIAATLEDLSGSQEVTVWPELYERTREFWGIGSILLCAVKVKTRGDRLSLGVEGVEQYLADETAGDASQEASIEAEFTAAETVLHNTHNGSGMVRENGNGWRGQGRNGGGNGGYANGRNGHEPAPTSQRPRVLRLTITETEDIESDRARLQDLVDTLRGFAGSDPVRLTVHTAGGGRADMALAPVSATEPLRKVVIGILGPNGTAAIEQL